MSVRYSAAAEEAREKINIAHAICTESLRMILREIDSHGAPNYASVAAARELLAEADTAHMTVLEIGRQASVRISAPEPEKIKLPLECAPVETCGDCAVNNCDHIGEGEESAV